MPATSCQALLLPLEVVAHDHSFPTEMTVDQQVALATDSPCRLLNCQLSKSLLATFVDHSFSRAGDVIAYVPVLIGHGK